MFEIEIDRGFSAAHQLKGYDGDCRNLHGHNYEVTVTVHADSLNEIGIALDFKRLKAALDEVISPYDHRNLSELPDFQDVNPTSEVLARTIFRKMSAIINDGRVRVAKVRIGESASSRLTYSE
ncbi:MAG: 6-carboxytetrahydropterin synthase QueD [Lentisphaeria bacterium]|nr:6-carboxytetrahydropterin synthase QueD [Lentisphaeria bacterium]